MGPAFSYYDAMRKARIMRAYDCTVARSGAIDAEFVLEYGKETLLQRREALRSLLEADVDGLDHSLYRDTLRRSGEKAVHDSGVLGHRVGTLALLEAVFGVRLSEARPPRHVLEARQPQAQLQPVRPWLVAGAEVERRLADPEIQGRALLAAMAPALTGKPFNLRVAFPAGGTGWTAEAAFKCLRAVLKAFGLTVEAKRHGNNNNRRYTYELALSPKTDKALSKVHAEA